MAGVQLSEWRMNRTTLLHKGKDLDGRIVKNYRPLTVSSLLCRFYYGILDTKLRSAVEFTPRQKGFVFEPGCFNNVHILSEVLRHSKENARDLVLVQLDVTKAFETVPHAAFAVALAAKGLSEQVIRIVEDSYRDVHTSIKVGSAAVDVFLQRGVKQGDPLSPFLSNTVMEPLLHKLQKESGYLIHRGQSIAYLAFADDILLFAGSVSQPRD